MMIKYVCFLRAINIGGNNLIPMKELKFLFERIGFKDVKTFLNSGNVLFKSSEEDKTLLVHMIEQEINQTFHLSIEVMVITDCELNDFMINKPDWWHTDDKAIYHQAIFIIPPTQTHEIYDVMKEVTEYEKIADYKNIIYFSSILESFNKTRWGKIASTKINTKVTLRTSRTVSKISKLFETL